MAFLLVACYLTAVGASLGWWAVAHRRQRGPALLSDRPFTGHELAVLDGGVERAVDASLAALQATGQVTRRGDLFVWNGELVDEADPHPYRGDAPDRSMHPAEEAVAAALRVGPQTRVQLVAHLAPRAGAVEHGLARGGWLVPTWQRHQQAAIARAPLFAVATAGAALASHVPVATTLMWLLAAATVGLAAALPRHPRLTPRGQAALLASEATAGPPDPPWVAAPPRLRPALPAPAPALPVLTDDDMGAAG